MPYWQLHIVWLGSWYYWPKHIWSVRAKQKYQRKEIKSSESKPTQFYNKKETGQRKRNTVISCSIIIFIFIFNGIPYMKENISQRLHIEILLHLWNTTLSEIGFNLVYVLMQNINGMFSIMRIFDSSRISMRTMA